MAPPGDHRLLPTNSTASTSTDDLDLLMMRFRPIAPKPPNNGDPHLRLLPNPSTSHRVCHPRRAKSTKGKCPGVWRRRGRSCPTDCHTSAHPLEHLEAEVSEPGTGRTLQLMITEPSAGDESSGSVKASEADPFLQSTGCSGHSGLFVKGSSGEADGEGTGLAHPSPRPVIPKSPLLDLDNAAFSSSSSDPVARKRVLDVCLIVESVAKGSSCIQAVEQLLGQTDEERLTGLAAEDCPGFVTDMDKRVRWVNGAFERMMRAELPAWGERGEVGVRLVAAAAEAEECWSTREALFTSRLRIEYTWREERCPVLWGPRVVTVAPCDAWRLCSGGFAWRLDVKSALSLGRCGI